MGYSHYKNNTPQNQELFQKVTNLFLHGKNFDTISQILKIDNCQIKSILSETLLEIGNNREPRTRLNERHRRIIEFFYQEGYSQYKIAQILHCSKSTISNEINRCEKEGNYSAKQAQKSYDEINHKERGPRKLDKAKNFLDHFCKLFKSEKQSPESFAYKAEKEGFPGAKNGGETVCFKTIYNYIAQGLLDVDYADLPEAPKRKAKKEREIPTRDGKHTKGLSIDERPSFLRDDDGKIIEFGQFEMDCMLGKQGSLEPALLVLIELKTHFTYVYKLPSHSFDSVLEALGNFKESFGSEYKNVVKTITTDNGSEFIGLGTDEGFSSNVYFCHPGQPKEKPHVERIIRVLRFYFPKGKSLSEYSDADIEHAVECVNSHYRRSLEKNCAQDLYEQEMDIIYAA